MKRYYVSIFLFFVLMAGVAQDTTTVWISMRGKPVDAGSAAYLRHYRQENDSLWQVQDYFLEGGLHMSGTYSDADLSVKHGNFRFLAENGTKTMEGSYDHNVSEGFWRFWFENGNLKDHGKYLSDITEAQRDSIWNLLMEKNLAFFQIRESLKDSIWEYFHENGTRSGVELYQTGVLVESQYWNADGTEVASDAVVNRMPEFPGGDKELMKYLSKIIIYPKVAKRLGTQGTVYIAFQIDKEGYASNFAVYESASPELDNEALRVMQSMPPWNPGIAQNRFVNVDYIMPLAFRLR